MSIRAKLDDEIHYFLREKNPLKIYTIDSKVQYVVYVKTCPYYCYSNTTVYIIELLYNKTKIKVEDIQNCFIKEFDYIDFSTVKEKINEEFVKNLLTFISEQSYNIMNEVNNNLKLIRKVYNRVKKANEF